MNDQQNFYRESAQNITAMAGDESVRTLTREWLALVARYRYVYNWSWMGLPIIQLPADIVATQEVIWAVKPTVIIETGVARGGSIVFNASQLALLDACDRLQGKQSAKRTCIGIDIDIRSHNRSAIDAHPLASMIVLYEGSSITDETYQFVKQALDPTDRVMVVLDSNHTRDHVLREMQLYSSLVSPGSFMIVHDTGIEGDPEGRDPDRDWGRGNNPLTAVEDFLRVSSDFYPVEDINDKLLITSSPGGYLRRR